MSDAKERKVCPDCGGSNVWVNARAFFNEDLQQYEMTDAYESEGFCDDCDASIEVKTEAA